MQLPYTPIKEKLWSTEKNEYCATGWVLEQLWQGAQIKLDDLWESDPSTAIKLITNADVPPGLKRKLNAVYKKNDRGKFEEAFMGLLPTLDMYKPFFVQHAGEATFNNVRGKIKAIIDEWQVSQAPLVETKELALATK